MEIYRDNFELTVSEFLEGLNASLRRFRVTVNGEVTGRINRRGGVTYFSIHDQKEEAVLQCMAFNSALDRLGVELQEGMAIKVSGNPEVWKRTGSFTFKVFEILLTGEGALKRQFDALLKKLEAEGLFLPERKKPLPRFVSTVGLITAADREAHMDFVTHLCRRGLCVHLHDVRVEGAQAVEQIVKAIQWFNENMPDVEILVLTRGGGSLESLQAFNSEAVARAIYASRIPIISAIGHEKDITIADYVADLRASTPTHAGKMLSQDWEAAELGLTAIAETLKGGVTGFLRERKISLTNYELLFQSNVGNLFETFTHEVLQHATKLKLVNPELKLRQGYTMVMKNDKIVKSKHQLAAGDDFVVRFHDGQKHAKAN